MAEIKFLEVGKVKDAHGIKGELFVLLFASQADWLDQIDDLRLRVQGQIKIFKILAKSRHKNGLIVKVEGLNDRNAAEALKGSLFEIPESFLVAKQGEAIYLHEILNFAVHDKHLGFIGNIKDFESNGAQDLLVVANSERKALIPFVKAFVEQVDYKLLKIFVNLPEGLVAECAYK